MDTRTDVYALGVILYQLLTGTLPFDPLVLRDADPATFANMIRDMEPPPPSARVSDLTRVATERRSDVATRGPDRESLSPSSLRRSVASSLASCIAAHRGSDSKTLLRYLRGDLDWIVMKCLEKDRARRYETAAELAEDAQRYLNQEPVRARAPSRAYRLRKLVRRNRIKVAAGLVAGIAVVFGGVVGVSQALRASRAESQAGALADLALKTLKDTKLWNVGNAAELKGFLDQYRRMLDASDALSPEIECLLRGELAEGYRSFGNSVPALPHMRQAEPQLRRAVELSRAVYGLEDSRTLDLMINHANLLADLGRLEPPDLAQREKGEAWSLIREALPVAESVRGPDDSTRLFALHSLGMMMHDNAQYQSARECLTEVYERRTRLVGETDRATLSALAALTGVAEQFGDAAEAERLYRQLLDCRIRGLGVDDADTNNTRTNLASFLYRQDRPSDAADVQRDALQARRRHIGPDDRETLMVAHNLGAYLLAADRLGEAEEVLKDTFERRTRLLTLAHGNTIATQHRLGVVLMRKGDLHGAEALLREAAANVGSAGDTLVSRDHPAKIASDYGDCLRGLGRYPEAEPLLLKSYADLNDLLGAGHASTQSALECLVALYEEWDRPSQAETWRAKRTVESKR